MDVFLKKTQLLDLGKINQGRMDDFFKISKVVSTSKPTPKKDAKRKAGKQKGNTAKKLKRWNFSTSPYMFLKLN